MKNMRLIISIGATALGLISPTIVVAQTNTPPTTPPVVRHGGDGDLAADLKNVPPAVAKIIISFDVQRDKFLLQQHLLLEKLSSATTADERAAIREQLQDNRQAFLDQLAEFRLKLKDELQDLKGRISNAEFLRIIDAAKDVPPPAHFRHGK
jgi:hypothetical protein